MNLDLTLVRDYVYNEDSCERQLSFLCVKDFLRVKIMEKSHSSMTFRQKSVDKQKKVY